MEHEQRASELFQAALALEPDRRESFLRAACNDDLSLIQHIQRLLVADEACNGFLDPPCAEAIQQAQAGVTQSGQRLLPGRASRQALAGVEPSIGDSSRDAPLHPRSLPVNAIEGYDIVKLIRGGGQAVVYQAIHKSTRRKVAIKVMKEGPFAGMAERARFEREAQILGQLSHPNIVAIHDTGIASGCHYFVMDYVSGTSLDEHAEHFKRASPSAVGRKSIAGSAQGSDARTSPSDSRPSPAVPGSGASAAPRWAVRPILDLFVRVCEAVNAAHLRGIIHRDLKPGNIRVDDSGEPHILDFGLAKVIGGSSGGAAVTLTGEFLGSVHWASPEQAEQKPDKIDVRTDVYALGMILYHMLTGRFPYDVTGGMRDVLERIMAVEPIRPRSILPHLDHDLETILLKCLQKDRERRYQTAGDLARDAQRYLDGEPIDARRDSLTYMVGKLMRKHRVPAIISSAFLLLLVAGLALSLTLWRKAATAGAAASAAEQRANVQLVAASKARDQTAVARDEADAEAARALQVQTFIENIFALGAAEGGRNPRLRHLLDAASAQVEDEFGALPDVQAVADNMIGLAYQRLGELEQAERHLERAADYARQKLDKAHPDGLVYLNNLAGLRMDQSHDGAAEALYSEVLERSEGIAEVTAPRKLAAMHNLASSLRGRNRHDAAESILRRVMESRKSLLGPEHPDTLLTMNNLAACLVEQRKWSAAHELLAETLALQDRVLNETDSRRLDSLHSLGALLVLEGDVQNAARLYPRAIALSEAALGRQHPRTLITLRDHAVLLTVLGQYAPAIALLREVRAAQAEAPSRHAADTFTTENLLAEALTAAGMATEALATAEEALRRAKASKIKVGLTGAVSGAQYQAASARLALRQPEQAMQDCEAALRSRREADGDQHPPTFRTVNLQGRILLALGNVTDAVKALVDAASTSRQVFPEGHWLTAILQSDAGDALTHARQFAEAETNLLAAYAVLDRAFGRAHPHTQTAIRRLARLYQEWNKPERHLVYARLTAQSSQPAIAPSHR